MGFVYLFCLLNVDIQLFQHHLLKRLSFFVLDCLCTFVKINCHAYVAYVCACKSILSSSTTPFGLALDVLKPNTMNLSWERLSPLLFFERVYIELELIFVEIYGRIHLCSWLSLKYYSKTFNKFNFFNRHTTISSFFLSELK